MPREPTRKDMVRLGVQVGLVVLGAGALLQLVLTRDVEMHKIAQRTARAERYLVMAHDAVESWKREKGSPMPAEGAALPDGPFVDWFASRMGGEPHWREEGRVARLDMFGPSGPFRDPLLYAVAGDEWILVSRGPDGDFDVSADVLAGDGARERLAALTWDPTNGAAGSGDLWTGSLSPGNP